MGRGRRDGAESNQNVLTLLKDEKERRTKCESETKKTMTSEKSIPRPGQINTPAISPVIVRVVCNRTECRVRLAESNF